MAAARPTWAQSRDSFMDAVMVGVVAFYTAVTAPFRKAWERFQLIPREAARQLLSRQSIAAALSYMLFETAAIIEALKDDLADAPWIAIFAALHAVPALKIPWARSRALSGERFVNGAVIAILKSAREVVTFRPGTVINRIADTATRHQEWQRLLKTFNAAPVLFKALAKAIIDVTLQIFRLMFTFGTLVLVAVFVWNAYDEPKFEQDYGALFFGQKKPKVRLRGPYRTRKP